MKRYLRVALLALFILCLFPCAGACWTLTTGRPVVPRPTPTPTAIRDPVLAFESRLRATHLRVVSRTAEYEAWARDSFYLDPTGATVDRLREEARWLRALQANVILLPTPPECRPIRDGYMHFLSAKAQYYDGLAWSVSAGRRPEDCEFCYRAKAMSERLALGLFRQLDELSARATP